MFLQPNRISHNEIHNNGNVAESGPDNGQSGVFSATGVTDNTYTNNYVHHNGRSGDNAHLDHGLYLAGNNEVAANNMRYCEFGFRNSNRHLRRLLSRPNESLQ